MDFDLRESKFADTICNADHLTDLKFLKRYVRWFLRMLGIWPFVTSEPSNLERNLSKIVIPSASLLMLTLPFPIVVHLIIRTPDSSAFFFVGTPILFQLSNIITHYIMLMRSDSLKVCMQHMEKDWQRVENSADRDIMMRNLKAGNTLTVLCFTVLYSNVITYRVVLPLISAKTVDEFNRTLKPLAFPGIDIFFDPQRDGFYELAFGTTIVAGLMHYTVKCSVLVLTILMVSHACGQNQVVLRKLENLVQETEGQKERKAIVKPIESIVQNHVRLLRFSNRMEVAMREIFLVELSAMTIMVCLVEYCCLTEWNNSDRTAIFTYAGMSGTFATYIFVFCRLGERLTEQCLEIETKAYTIEWYKLPRETIVALDLIMIMASCPRRITAGGMMDLSLPNFAATIKTSFAYLNMLRTVT